MRVPLTHSDSSSPNGLKGFHSRVRYVTIRNAKHAQGRKCPDARHCRIRHSCSFWEVFVTSQGPSLFTLPIVTADNDNRISGDDYHLSLRRHSLPTR